MPHVNKKISLAHRKFFHTSISRSLKNSGMNKKPLSFRSALHFRSATKSLRIFSRVSFPASKFTPIKLIKKKDFSNTRLRVVKRQRPNTIQII